MRLAVAASRFRAHQCTTQTFGTRCTVQLQMKVSQGRVCEGRGTWAITRNNWNDQMNGCWHATHADLKANRRGGKLLDHEFQVREEISGLATSDRRSDIQNDNVAWVVTLRLRKVGEYDDKWPQTTQFVVLERAETVSAQ